MTKKYNGKNISVEWKFDLNEVLRNNFSNKEWADQSQYVVDQMILTKIDRGISPVNGVRTFQKYKNPERYPGNKKQNNKPNLALTGSMLSHYDARPGNEQMTITLGIHKDAPKEELIKAVANNEGTQSSLTGALAKSSKDKKLIKKVKQASKGIPARPFIPLKAQSFTRDITLAVRKYFAYCLDKAIKKGIKK